MPGRVVLGHARYGARYRRIAVKAELEFFGLISRKITIQAGK
jgi:hypothetical protein